jgi:hypothetical protein
MPGAVVVTEIAAEGVEVPKTSVAVTVKVYAVDGVNPEIVKVGVADEPITVPFWKMP